MQLDGRTRDDLAAETRARLAATCPELRDGAAGDPALTLTRVR